MDNLSLSQAHVSMKKKSKRIKVQQASFFFLGDVVGRNASKYIYFTFGRTKKDCCRNWSYKRNVS